VPANCLTTCASIDEAFIQRNLPDLGQEVEDTQVFTWQLTNWKKLERKLTGPDFPCGGHKWQVDIHSPWPRGYLMNNAGEFYYFPLAMPVHHPMILYRFTWTMLTQKHLRIGTRVPNSH
jgi:hypothetical protein